MRTFRSCHHRDGKAKKAYSTYAVALNEANMASANMGEKIVPYTYAEHGWHIGHVRAFDCEVEQATFRSASGRYSFKRVQHG